jgi:flagellar assembly protein FliH
MASGRAAVEEQAAAVAQQVAALRSIALSFGRDLAQADDIVAQDMLGLALDLAKAMLKTALPAKPELVLPVVSEAIRYLPTVQQPALLFLHPEDAIVVNSHMQDELGKAGWRVAEDRHLERGGCRVETASNQIDATVAGRWQRIAAALGKTEGWLE